MHLSEPSTAKQFGTAGNQRIKGFDGLRAIAILMVWLDHRTSIASGFGGAGVLLFFILSGFLIVDILRRQRQKIEAGHSSFGQEWRRFVVRRAYRIFPVYYLYLAIIIPCAVIAGDKGMDLVAVVMHVFYLVNIWLVFIAHDWNLTTTHLWSLSVEEQFYVLFPLLCLVTPSRHIQSLCAVIVAVGLAVYFYLVLENYHFALSAYPPVGFAKIALGGFFVTALSNGPPRPGRSSFVAAMALAVFILIPIVAGHLHSSFILTFMQFVPTSLVAGLLLLEVKNNQDSVFVSWLEVYPLRTLGLVSYGFYVYHYALSIKFLSYLTHIDLGQHLNSFEAHAIDLALPVAAAALSWRFVEQPILKLRMRAMSRPIGGECQPRLSKASR